ncbi:MAG: hypothetical protein CFE45_43680, partial [Burkholderiales bacterium PBB5]
MFEGGFTLTAAEAVLDLSATAPDAWLPDVLQALQEKSLLRRSAESRWDLLQSVHEYAAEQLAALGDDAATRHWRHFAAMNPAQSMTEYRAEIDNLVIACRRAMRTGQQVPADLAALRGAAGSLVNAWGALRLTGPFRLAQELAAQLLASPALPAATRAAVQRVAGASTALLGDLDAAARHYADGIEAALSANDLAQHSMLLSMLGELTAQRGQLSEAGSLIERGLQTAGEATLPRITALNALGSLALARSQPDAAE